MSRGLIPTLLFALTALLFFGLGSLLAARNAATNSPGAVSCDSTRRNQLSSTSAMCRTRPSSDMLEGETDRSRNCASVSPSHFHASV